MKPKQDKKEKRSKATSEKLSVKNLTMLGSFIKKKKS
jgi:hypothetical protein